VKSCGKASDFANLSITHGSFYLGFFITKYLGQRSSKEESVLCALACQDEKEAIPFGSNDLEHHNSPRK
jgi:hypothetical protein